MRDRSALTPKQLWSGLLAIVLFLFATLVHSGEVDRGLFGGTQYLIDSTDGASQDVAALLVLRAELPARFVVGGRLELGELENVEALNTFQSLTPQITFGVRAWERGALSVSVLGLYGYSFNLDASGGFDTYGACVRVGTDADYWLHGCFAKDEAVDEEFHPGVAAWVRMRGPLFFRLDRFFAEGSRTRVGVFLRIVK